MIKSTEYINRDEFVAIVELDTEVIHTKITTRALELLMDHWKHPLKLRRVADIELAPECCSMKVEEVTSYKEVRSIVDVVYSYYRALDDAGQENLVELIKSLRKPVEVL